MELPSTLDVVSVSTTALAVTRLVLANFRNHAYADMHPHAGVIALVGHNGAGKTNVLEAVSLLSAGRGLRGATLPELQRHAPHPQPWSVFAELHTGVGSLTIGTGMEPDATENDRRTIKINGQVQRGQKALSEHISLLSFTPQMSHVFTEGTTAVRLFLDRLVASFFPDYTRNLAVFEYAKSERKRILAMRTPDAQWLDTQEKKMAEQAVAIASARHDTLYFLKQAMTSLLGEQFPRAELRIEGTVEDALTQHSALQAESLYRDVLVSERALDAQTQRTNSGPHRSLLYVTHSLRGMPAHLCSTGEQKALLLSLLLASAHAKKAWQGYPPIMLLDEVVAHMDEQKRAEFFAEMLAIGAQCWLTGTDNSLFSGLGNKAQFFTVAEGRIIG